jgi:hypothetical protein
MRFQRQPRVLGTRCLYVPSNTITQTQGLEYGLEVRIVSHPTNGNDLFVGVIPSKDLPVSRYGLDRVDVEWVKKNIKEEDIKLVLWKDLAQ